jgi:protein involved in polysaccharide export with SLBB domain
MKYIFIFTFIIFTSVTISQEFNEDYLQSLPKEVREDVLKRANSKSESEKPIYRNPSSQLEKTFVSTGIFGEKFFTSYQSTFMPINEPNFDTNYILDYGDVLKIQLIGQKDLIENYQISRDGSINFPDIGKIYLSGIPLKEATSIIKAKVSSAYIGIEAFISLESVRDVNVIVSGNVFNPGIYTLSGNSNPLHALVMAGGIDEFGSYRDIKVKRGNKVIHTIDVYDFLINGRSETYHRLQSGDLVFVEKAQKIVLVQGGINRPMKYELKNDETLDKAIHYANGYSPLADIKNISINRINSGSIEVFNLVPGDSLSNYLAKDEDVISIKTFKYRNVSINGSIENPGNYLIEPGQGIMDIVNRAGGYTKNAYPYGGILLNEEALTINAEANKNLYENLLDIIIDITSRNPEVDNESLFQLAALVKDTESNGRIQTEFDINKLMQDSSKDIILKNNDEIFIPEKVNHIYVYGEISNQGTVSFKKNKDLNYYINKKGGLLDSADSKSIYVLLPNGETFRLNQRKRIFSNNISVSSQELYPGSIIFIPREIDGSYIRRQSIQAYVGILGNLGISLASLSVLKD